MTRLSLRLALLSLWGWAVISFGVAPHSAYAQVPESVIQGRVYVDLNGSGAYDPEDIALSGFPLEFADGEAIVQVLTDAEGLFALQVTPGVWRGRPVPPPGVSFPEDFSLETSIPEGEPTQVDLDIAVPVAIFQAWAADQPEGLPNSQEPVADEAEEQPDPSVEADEVEPQVYDGPVDSIEPNLPLQLLPESGATLGPRVLLVVVGIALFLIGSLMVIVGRRAASL